MSTSRTAAALTRLPPPAALTQLLHGAPSARLLLQAHGSFRERCLPVHCAAVWSRLGKLARGSGEESSWVQRNASAIEPLHEHTIGLLSHFGPRQISATAHGAATASEAAGVGVGAWAPLWSALAAAAAPQLEAFQPAELKDAAWAFATARAPDRHIFGALASEVHRRLDALTPTEVSVLSWSFVRAGHECPALLSGLAAAAEGRLGLAAFRPPEASMLAWALARAELPAASVKPFFAALAASLTPERLDKYPSHALATVASAGALSGFVGSDVLINIAEQAVSRPLSSFSAASLASLAMPYALSQSLPSSDAPVVSKLLAAIAEEAKRRVPEFDAPSLSNLARSYSEAVAVRRAPPQPELFAAIAAHVAAELGGGRRRGAGRRRLLLSERELSTLPYAFSKARHEAPPLFDAIALEAAGRLAEFSAGGLNSLAVAFARQHALRSRADRGARPGAKAQSAGEADDESAGAADDEPASGSATDPVAVRAPSAAVSALLDALAEELTGRQSDLEEEQRESLSKAFGRLGRPDPFWFAATSDP